jgi:hypothetical protein
MRHSSIESEQPVARHLVVEPGTAGVVASSNSGTISVTGRSGRTTLQITSEGPGEFPVTFDVSQGGVPLPNVTLDVQVDP